MPYYFDEKTYDPFDVKGFKGRIYDKNGNEVRIGDTVYSFRGEEYILSGIDRLPYPGKSGKVYVKKPGEMYGQTFYANVFGLTFEGIDAPVSNRNFRSNGPKAGRVSFAKGGVYAQRRAKVSQMFRRR